MLNAQINIVKNDQLFFLVFNIMTAYPKNPNIMMPVDLLNTTEIKFQVAPPRNTKNLIVNGTCQVTQDTTPWTDPADPTHTVIQINNICRYQVQPGDFTKVGMYKGEIVFTYVSGQIISARNIQVTIEEDLG